jgi:ribosome-associated translation inhibitor RaiA
MIDRKLEKLERMLNDAAVSAQVVLAMQKYRRVAEIVLHVRGDHMLTGIGEGASWPAALTSAVEKVSQQAQTVKGKWQKRRRRAVAVDRRPPATMEETADGDTRDAVVPDTRYTIRTLTVPAAAAAVGARAGAFLVFRNRASNAVSVAYRRPDGRIGLIDTEG